LLAAISLSALQNGSSRVKLVLRPATTMDRLGIDRPRARPSRRLGVIITILRRPWQGDRCLPWIAASQRGRAWRQNCAIGYGKLYPATPMAACCFASITVDCAVLDSVVRHSNPTSVH